MITNTGCKKLRDLELNSGCGKCFTIAKEYEVLIPEETLVMIPDPSNPQQGSCEIDSFGKPDLIRATVDGKEYELKPKTSNNITYYGEVPLINTLRWLNYDFTITVTANNFTKFITHDLGNHTIKIEEITKTCEGVSEDFRMAVQYVIDDDSTSFTTQ